MALTRHQLYRLSVSFCLGVLTSTTLLCIQAEPSVEEPVASIPASSLPRPAQEASDFSTDNEATDPPSLHEYLVRFFSSPNSDNHEFLEMPESSLPPRTLCEAHADHGPKTATAAQEEGVLLQNQPQDSEDQASGVALEGTVLDAEPNELRESEDQASGVNVEGTVRQAVPLRTVPPATLLPNTLRLSSPLPIPFSLYNADEWIMTSLFRLWAALHPQDAAYYTGLSQRATMPSLSPITGLYDMISMNDQVYSNLTDKQKSPAVDLTGTTLQNLLLELVTRPTAESIASQVGGS